jgi:hypothetical protein
MDTLLPARTVKIGHIILFKIYIFGDVQTETDELKKRFMQSSGGIRQSRHSNFW